MELFRYSDIFCPRTDITFYHFRPFFALLLHYWPRNFIFGNNVKARLQILSFYTCVPLIKITWCMVPEIWSLTDRIFLSFSAIFGSFTPLIPLKMKKKPWRYHHFTQMYQIIMIIRYTVPEKWCATDIIVIFHFGIYF